MYMDPIADLLVQLKMGTKAKKSRIIVKTSKLKTAILALLKSEGYIEDFKTSTKNKIASTTITLKYRDGVSSITGLKQVSKPGLRVYVESTKIPRILNGLGIAIVSTSSGLMCDKHARKLQIGGELIAYVW